MVSQFPLSKVTATQLQELTQILWSWSTCAECLAGKECNPPACAWHRSPILKPFFDFYREETLSYRSDLKQGQKAALESHEDLFAIIKELKASPDAKRVDLVERLFSDRPVRSDQERAVDLAVRVMLMVNCSAPRQDSVLVEDGNHQFPWRNDVTFTDYVRSIFNQKPHPGIIHIKENLRAFKLKKRSGLKFEPTNDIRSHLKFDHKKTVVKIFHHAAFLKEQLKLTKNEPQSISVSKSLQLGALPRALALETLDSIQTILFQLTESKSKALLRSLISSSNFDKDIISYDFSTICNPDEKEVSYQYFTTELGDLYEEQSNPTPRGVKKWFEKKSGARYVMMATIAGIVFVVLSLGLSAFQAWIGWQQWQHPVS